jgi:hypothetical protein
VKGDRFARRHGISADGDSVSPHQQPQSKKALEFPTKIPSSLLDWLPHVLQLKVARILYSSSSDDEPESRGLLVRGAAEKEVSKWRVFPNPNYIYKPEADEDEEDFEVLGEISKEKKQRESMQRKAVGAALVARHQMQQAKVVAASSNEAPELWHI